MFELTKAPPSSIQIEQQRARRKMQQVGLALLSAPCFIGVLLIPRDTSWTLYGLAGCVLGLGAVFTAVAVLRRNSDWQDMPQDQWLRMKVFAKGSGLCRHYYARVQEQQRPFLVAEYRLLEKEFKRASGIREQDIKSGNARLFQPRTSGATPTSGQSTLIETRA